MSDMADILDFLGAEVDRLTRGGHTLRLEQCIARLHLAYARAGISTRLGWAASPEAGTLFQALADLLAKCFTQGTNDVDAPVMSDNPFAIVCSYPRSGNTMLINMAASVMLAQVFENMPGSRTPFSKKIYPRHYPYVRLIKDHVARPMYRQDRVAFVVRDGRDTMISLAYMTHKQGYHDFVRRDQLADFIIWLDQAYPFGGWAKHMRDMHALLPDNSTKFVTRYEDVMEGPQPFFDFIRFLDSDHGLDEARMRRAYDARAGIIEEVKNHPSANGAWGIGAQFDPDSLFFEWSKNRGGSTWRASWDAAARKRFHETGATDYLIEYGYESDEKWWKL